MFAPSTFRQQFPEFKDPQVFPDPVLYFWSGLAASMLPEDRWGSLLDYGVSLFVAHHLVISERNQRASGSGGVLGQEKGPLKSRTVDKVTESYDTDKIALTDAGFWNATSYGQRFYQLVRMAGAGGVQL